MTNDAIKTNTLANMELEDMSPHIQVITAWIEWIAGLVANLRGLENLTPSTPSNIELINVAVFSRYPVSSSRGNITDTQIKLKKSCTVAALMARLNSSRRLTCPRDTSVLVTVVPILAPMMMGMAQETSMTPEPTIPTTMEVVVEEL